MSAPKASELQQDLHWECGWEAHKHSQFLRLAHLPLSDKLSWLEQAHRTVLQLSLDHSSNIKTEEVQKTEG